MSERQRASDDADSKTDLAPPAPVPKATAHNCHANTKANGQTNVNGNTHANAKSGSSTAAAPPPWSPPPPPKCIHLETDQDRTAWRKAMRFCALWEEAIVRSGALGSSNFTLTDKQAAYSYFQKHPETSGLFTLAVAIHAWHLAYDRAQPDNSRRRVYHIPHSLDPRHFLGSMHSGKIGRSRAVQEGK